MDGDAGDEVGGQGDEPASSSHCVHQSGQKNQRADDQKLQGSKFHVVLVHPLMFLWGFSMLFFCEFCKFF